MKTRKTKRLWFLEKVVFCKPKRPYSRLPSIVEEGVAYCYNRVLYVALANGGTMCIELEYVTKKLGKLGREECLTHSNQIIREIGLDDRLWK